jgi:hypothetical protein
VRLRGLISLLIWILNYYYYYYFFRVGYPVLSHTGCYCFILFCLIKIEKIGIWLNCLLGILPYFSFASTLFFLYMIKRMKEVHKNQNAKVAGDSVTINSLDIRD